MDQSEVSDSRRPHGFTTELRNGVGAGRGLVVRSSGFRQVELRPCIGRNEIKVFRVTRDAPPRERAVRQHRDPTTPHLVEGLPHQDRRETTTGETRIDFCVGEGVPVPLNAVDSETGKITTNVELESVPPGRVADDRFGLGRRSNRSRLRGR